MWSKWKLWKAESCGVLRWSKKGQVDLPHRTNWREARQSMLLALWQGSAWVSVPPLGVWLSFWMSFGGSSNRLTSIMRIVSLEFWSLGTWEGMEINYLELDQWATSWELWLVFRVLVRLWLPPRAFPPDPKWKYLLVYVP